MSLFGLMVREILGAGEGADLGDAGGLEGAADPELGRRAQERRPRQVVRDHRFPGQVEHLPLARPDGEQLSPARG